MHFNAPSFLSATLAVSAFFASNAVARPHGHAQAHSGLHAINHAKRHLRSGPWKRDALQTLQSEVESFEGFMSSFIQAGSTDSGAISQLQSQVQEHVQAVQTFASSAGSDPSVGSIPQLQADTSAFKVWMDTWAQNVAFSSSTAAMDELSQEIQSYEGWLDAFLGLSGPSTGTAPAQSPTSVPLPPAPTGPTTTLTTLISQTSTDMVMSTQTVTGSPAPITPSAAPSPSPSEVPLPVSSAPSSAPAAPSSAQPASPSPSPSPPSSGSDSPKLAAWWGQTSAASTYGLQSICSDDSYDIVMLSFLNNFFSAGGMPTLNLGPATGDPSAAQTAAGATDLFNGADLVAAINTCQSSGKKVMLTLGGAAGYSQSQFSSDDQATAFAGTIWDLFLGGESALRPFGADVKLDGIDVDNENKDQTGYTAFVSALRSKFGEDSSKGYYISGAPQCPQPDESIPLDAMRNMDWVSTSLFVPPILSPPSFPFYLSSPPPPQQYPLVC